MSAARAPRSAYLAWAAICVLWGTTYLAIKIALETVPPMLIGGVRYLIAGPLLLTFLRLRGDTLPARRTWPMYAVLGFLMLGVGNGGVVWAEQYVPSGLAAVIIATSPFWMVAVDSVVSGTERLTAQHWVGLLIGFSGIVMLVWPDLVAGGAAGRNMLIGIGALQLACLGWSLGSSYGKRSATQDPPIQVAAMQMLTGGLWMTAMGTMLGEWSRFDPSWRSLTAILYLALFGGLAGFAAYIYALAHLPVSFVSLYAYVNPVIAVALGTVIMGEAFTPRMMVAVAVILAGTAIVSLARSKPPAS